MKKILLTGLLISCLSILTSCGKEPIDEIASNPESVQFVLESSEVVSEETEKAKLLPIKLVSYPDFSKIYGKDMLTDAEKPVFDAYLKLYEALTPEKTYEFPPVRLEDLTVINQIFRNNYEPLYQSIVDYGYGIESQPLDALEGITSISISKGIKTERFEQANKRAEEILTSIVCEDTDYAKCVAISRWLCDNVVYDGGYGTDEGENPESHLYSLPLLEGVAVCEGYAKAFNFLAHRAGIESICVNGEVDSGGHMWNMVRVEDDWYNIDTTWMDMETDTEYNNRYFMASDEQMSDHRNPEYVYLPLGDTRSPIRPKAVSAKYNPKD